MAYRDGIFPQVRLVAKHRRRAGIKLYQTSPANLLSQALPGRRRSPECLGRITFLGLSFYSSGTRLVSDGIFLTFEWHVILWATMKEWAQPEKDLRLILIPKGRW